MELLLNLVWLMLAVPAALVCMQGRRVAPYRGFFGRFQSVVVLSSILVLVFPVISLTDDLMALRADVEESNSSNRAVKSSTADASGSKSLFGFHLWPAHAVLVGPQVETWSELSLLSVPCADRLLSETVGCRAPPVG
jgi:hypothetical protein